MGFSLAQMSLNLVVPAHAADVYSKPVALFAFFATFLIVASTWYSHHWLFDYLFVPTASTIVVNFATLASLVWLVYQFQLFLHFAPTPDGQLALLSYLTTFAVTWLLLGLLYGLCLRLRWNALADAERKSGLFKTGRITTIGVATVGSTVALWAFHQPVETTFWVILAASILYRAVARLGGLRG
jgi:uncharacterized membrane protein